MGWLESLFSTGFVGGFIGLAGTVVNKYFEFKMEKMRSENIRLQGQVDLEIIKAESEGRFKIAQTEAEASMEMASSEAFKSSYSIEPKMYHSNSKVTAFQNSILVFVDAIRGIIRPLLTVSFCASMMIVYFKAGKIIEQKDLSPEQALKIYLEVTQAIIFLTTLSVSWWFGERAVAGRFKKK